MGGIYIFLLVLKFHQSMDEVTLTRFPLAVALHTCENYGLHTCENDVLRTFRNFFCKSYFNPLRDSSNSRNLFVITKICLCQQVSSALFELKLKNSVTRDRNHHVSRKRVVNCGRIHWFGWSQVPGPGVPIGAMKSSNRTNHHLSSLQCILQYDQTKCSTSGQRLQFCT